MITQEDIKLGLAGAMLNNGPEFKDCTGHFDCEDLNAYEVIQATSLYLVNFTLAHFEKQFQYSPSELAEMRPLFETFNNQELQRSKIIPTVAASIEQEHE